MRSLSYLGWRHKESFPLGMSHALRQAERAGQHCFVSTAAVKSVFSLRHGILQPVHPNSGAHNLRDRKPRLRR